MGMFWPDPPDPREHERISRINFTLMYTRALGDAFAALADLCPQNAALKMGAAKKVAKMAFATTPLSMIIRWVELEVWPDLPGGGYRHHREALDYLARMADAPNAAEVKEWAMALQTALLRKSTSMRAVVEVLSAEVDHTTSVLEQELRKLGVE